MCGIAGLFAYDGGELPPEATAERLSRMVETLRHRGPDELGGHLRDGFALGHSRLSIIDRAGGHQPLVSEDRRVAVVINGEIYNHRALRRDLESRGHRFATGSDGEVVVHLYEEMGERCVNLLAGMFAFAVADFGRRRLLLARDRVGKKPLYLADDGRSVAFASELKALRAGGVDLAIDPEALDLYLALGYVPAPWTIAAGVRKLPAGHLAVCDGNGLRMTRYWDVQDAVQGARPLMVRGGGRRAERILEERLTDELEARLAAAVGARLESEVPLGAFLSGGIDSGVVVAMMGEALRQPVLTHTVGFADRERDERAAAAAVARFLGTDHAEFEVRPELADLLPRIAWHLDEPFADPSTVPTWYVARETRRRVTVALSGDGGDELFAGYPARYRMHLAERRLRPLLPAALARRALPPLARLWPRSPRLPRPLRAGSILENLAVSSDRAYWNDRRAIRPGLLARLAGRDLAARAARFDAFGAFAAHFERAPQSDPLARVLYLDFKTWLADDGLVKVDRMSMAHALEVRCPLLDHELVEFAFALPSRWKLARGTTKLLLRRVAARRLPPDVVAGGKRGFAPPVSGWLRGPLRDFSRDLLLGPDAFSRELFDRRALACLLADHEARREEAGWAIWTLLMLEVWGREVLGGAPIPERLAAPERADIRADVRLCPASAAAVAAEVLPEVGEVAHAAGA
jgi:asparagine synthase (glutamine-hydrolysing)